MPAASPKTRVLVVEDDERTARWLVLYLEREGLEVRVAASADEALASVTEAPPALVLLDVMLPGSGGFDVCRAIRAGSTVPIIFITARTGEDDRLTGFDLGADDYITKPFSPREVVARVRAVLRRSTDAAAAAPEARLGDMLLRTDALTVSRGGAQVKLTPVEARLLSALMAAPKRVLTRQQLVSRACGDDYEGDLGDLARASARQLRLESESVNVSQVVAQTIAQAAPRAASIGVRVESAVPGDGLTLWGDRARVQQVLSNLLDNALAHTPAGGAVTFDARRAAGDTIIEVRDTGEGIAAEHLPHVFDRFYRADPSRSRATGGAGLGLAIARQVVEASGGRISAASVPGAGTTFEVRWPSFTASS